MAYKGTPIVMDNLLYKPKNSLINQSLHAREIEEPLNGDGFGAG
jgi:predicted glutamine amidotransferase